MGNYCRVSGVHHHGPRGPPAPRVRHPGPQATQGEDTVLLVSRPALSCVVSSCPGLFCHALCRLVMTWLVLSCLVSSRHVLACFVMPSLVSSRHVLPCVVSSCPDLFCYALSSAVPSYLVLLYLVCSPFLSSLSATFAPTEDRR